MTSISKVWGLGWNIPSPFLEREIREREWITLDGKGYGKGLKADLGRNLIGQHIASDVILNAVTGFMNNDNPKKSLVLSFHGTSGTGKSLASQLIVKNIFKKGMDSRFVHFFNSVYNFPHASQVETYKSQLQLWIRGNVTNCAHSMFIFDEMDKINPRIIDSMKPFMDYHYKLDGVSYQKAIFLFLSNGGGETIRERTLVSWKAGKKREELKLEDLETALSSFAFNYYGESNVVDFFIPFLPLEHQHIVQCIMFKMVLLASGVAVLGRFLYATPRPIDVPGLGVPVVPHTQQAVGDLEDLQTRHKGPQQLQEVSLHPWGQTSSAVDELEDLQTKHKGHQQLQEIALTPLGSYHLRNTTLSRS
ncbi:unnamed protein product [Boreogadus saida]